jgi:hypothetical protein
MPEINPSAKEIHDIEQSWAEANSLLQQVLDAIIHDNPIVTRATGLSDASIIYKYIGQSINKKAQTEPLAGVWLLVICTAALTKLACQAPHAPDDPLARLENEVNDNDS